MNASFPRSLRLLAVLGVVALAVAPAAVSQSAPADHISVGGEVARPFSVSLDELRALPHKTIQVMNEHDKKQETYEGVPLADLLKQAGVPQGEAVRGPALALYVIAQGSDGYRALFSLAELDASFQDSNVIVADRLDGAPMNASVGPLRLVAPNDKRPGRWVRMLQSITVAAAPQ
jgi:hypothetical protein